MKIARAIPLYKNNSKLEPSNYRPYILHSKHAVQNLERAVHIQLETYLKENYFINFNQVSVIFFQPIHV